MSGFVQGWKPATKRSAVLMLIVVLALLIYLLRSVLPPLILAFLLAFILDPVVDFLEARTRLSRTAATALVFVLLILTLLAAPAVAVPPLVKTIRSLNLDFNHIADDIDRFLAKPVTVLNWQLDLRTVYQELQQSLRSFFSAVAKGTLNVVVSFVSTLVWVIFILLSAFYMTRDADRIVGWVDNLPPPSLQGDFVRLRTQITQVWHAFLRGQLVLGLLMAAITAVVDTAIGLPNALALGLLAGAMEVVPNVGPVIAAVPAIAIAFFQGSAWLPISNGWCVVLVVGTSIVIQQIENQILGPRVIGGSLNLHPLIVLVAVIAGGSIGGILGVVLAAPIVATLRVLANYAYCRLTDRDPFPQVPAQPRGRAGIFRRLWDWTRRRRMAGQWVVRPARPEDQADVEVICAQAGEEDYVPGVWEDWLADPHGQLAVVERKGRVVALGKLSRLADDEWWLEGLRVDPAYRRLGVAALLQTHEVQLAQQTGQGVLRAAIASHNVSVHRNLARDGFDRLAEFAYYGADALPGPCALQPLPADAAEGLAQLMSGSPILRAAGGLYEVGWHWMSLTDERIADHLAAGEVWGLEQDGRLAAVAIVPQAARSARPRIGYLDGTVLGITALVLGLRVLANQIGCDGIRIHPPVYPPLLQALEAAGMTRVWAHNVWVFQKLLEGEK